MEGKSVRCDDERVVGERRARKNETMKETFTSITTSAI